MRETLAYLVRALVDHPGDVQVEMEESGDEVLLAVRVHPDDMGQVIGRQGRVAKALRSVLRAVGRREGKRVTVDIRETPPAG
jgi:predicted RNA-binding protein YlqC (UPF0109 family)